MFTLTKKTYAIKSWIALSSLAAFSACEAPVQNQSFLSTAPAALPQHIEEQALSCIALSTSLVGLSDTAVSLNGNASVSGSVVLLGSSTLNVTGNAIVKDGVYVRSDANVRASGHANGGVIHEQDFTSDEPRLLDFARSLDRLTSTQVLSGLSGSVSLSGNGGINVIEVDGDVNLAGQDQLTLGGGANDIYVFNVRGSFLMSGQANVLVSDSMLPGHVLFYLGASSTSVSVTGKGHLDGTVFAPNGTAQISGNGSISGLVIAKDTLQVSGNGFTISPAPFCPGMFLKSPVPAPTPTPTGVSPTPTPTPTPTGVSPTPTPTPTDVSPTPTPTPTGVSPTPTPTPTSTSIPDCMGSDCSNPIFGV